MNSAISVAIALSLLAVASCQHTPQLWSLSEPDTLLVDETQFYGQLYPIETADEIFRLPQQIKAELRTLSTARQGMMERSKAILEYIMAHTGDSFSYNLALTRTVSETLATRQANCLSLSILTYSIAKEVGLAAVFQDVRIPEYWSTGVVRTTRPG